MKRVATLMFGFVVVLGVVGQVGAKPITVRLMGDLVPTGGDSFDFSGASIVIEYNNAGTSDTPTSTLSGAGTEASTFDVFDMSLSITNRPAAAPDINDGNSNAATVFNRFPPSTSNDVISFDSRQFFPIGGPDIRVLAVSLDLGSQIVLPGTASPADLDIFNQLPEDLTALATSFGIIVDESDVNELFTINILTVTNFTNFTNSAVLEPEPSTILLWLLMALGGAGYAYYRRRKMKSLQAA